MSQLKIKSFGGGSGVEGSFALIKIEYPVGQPVTVTFDGDTIEAPDDSGLWMYGCEETGTYTIAITGTTASQTVQITTQGQIETVWISPQVINYGLIYHLGNEFTNVDGTDEAKYAISTGGWENIRATNSVLYEGSQIGYKTSLNINTSGYNYIGAYKYVTNGEYQSSPPTIYNGGAGGFRNGGGVDNPFVTKFFAQNRSGVKGFVVGNLTDVNTNICFSIGTQANRGNFSNAKNENNLYCRMTANGGSYAHTGYTYSVFLYKTDNISGLSAYGNDISTILSNSTNLFTDVSALNWMVTNCTGDFMISALSNTNFINAMNSSANKSILVANEHWNRFIALLSV